jgi:hypothetical protein
MTTEPRIEARWIDPRTEREVKADVINPGDACGDGKAYLLAVADCWDPPVFVVESERWAGDCAAYETFACSEIGERMMRIEADDLGDYDPEELRYNENGTPIDDDNLWMDSAPKGMRYHGDGLPSWGVPWKAYRAHVDAIDHAKRDAAWAGKRQFFCPFDPRDDEPTEPEARAIYREAYARAFMSHSSPCTTAHRAARRYLRFAGFPF